MEKKYSLENLVMHFFLEGWELIEYNTFKEASSALKAAKRKKLYLNPRIIETKYYYYLVYLDKEQLGLEDPQY